MELSNRNNFESLQGSGITLMMSRVAICSVGELFGGVERHILGLISELRTNGITTILFLFHDGELAKQARLLGIKPVFLRNNNRSLLTTSKKLAHLLKQHQIRIVHVHGYKATVYCTFARYWYQFAMVKTEHGLPEPQAGGGLQAMRARFYPFLEGIATRIASPKMCYVTQELLEHQRQSHKGLQGKVIPNGVTVMNRCQYQRPMEFQGANFNMTVIGRLTPVKGHHLAIEAVATLGLSPNELSLYIIGNGPYEEQLKASAIAQGVASQVHFLGFRRNVFDYIAHSDVLLIPSLHEGLPYTLLEAMALGVPIIASRVGGLAEVLEDSITGLLVPSSDTAALAHAISRLYSDPDFRHRLGENARRRQQANYSLESMTKLYLDVYREAIVH